MLTLYEFRKSSPEWMVFCDAMERKGHFSVMRYERVTPSDPMQIWPMGDYYLTERGEKCWPWVIFASGSSDRVRGYYLEGVAPLAREIKETAPKPPRPKRPKGKAAKAADWFIGQAGKATRRDAAEKFKVSQSALCVALAVRDSVPKSRRDSKSARAARWLSRHPRYSRYDAARLFGCSYGSVCRAVLSYGFSIKPALQDLSDEAIDELRRVRGLFDDGEQFEIRAAAAGLDIRY